MGMNRCLYIFIAIFTFPEMGCRNAFWILRNTGREKSAGILHARRLCSISQGWRETEQPLTMNQSDRKSTRLNSSHSQISYAVFCLKKKKNKRNPISSQMQNKTSIHSRK